MRSKIIEISGLFYPGLGLIAMLGLLFLIVIENKALAQADQPPCTASDTACLMPELEALAARITDASWRDQIYREIAKLYMAKSDRDRALAILPKIETPDTRALTIRGIGMEAARLNLPPDALAALFSALRTEADKIDHTPSHGIALTYIAMAQAFAKDDSGAFATARSMTNDALRHKAFAESAEIQAERGDLDRALQSLAAIDSESFRNKAHLVVAKIFADQKMFDHALATTTKISNDYQRSQAMLYLLAKQITPTEITLGIRE